MAVPAQGSSGSDPNWQKWISPNRWEVYLLSALGLPITHTTVTALDMWTLSEDFSGHFNGGNNPLAISGMNPGAIRCISQCNGSSPVMAYDTLQHGLDATAKFLQGKGNGYPQILAAFAAADYGAEQAVTAPGSTVGGKPVGNVGLLSNIWVAINASGWCKGCQGGKYPAQLVNFTNGQFSDTAGLNALGADAASLLGGTPITGFTPSEQGAVTPTSLTPSPSDLAKFLGLPSINLGAVGTFALGAGVFIVGMIIFVSNTKTGRTLEGEAARTATVAAMA